MLMLILIPDTDTLLPPQQKREHVACSTSIVTAGKAVQLIRYSNEGAGVIRRNNMYVLNVRVDDIVCVLCTCSEVGPELTFL